MSLTCDEIAAAVTNTRRALAESYARELPALRASHDRLLKALEVLDMLDGHEVVAVSGYRCSHCDAWEEARAAIAEARKIG